MYDLKKIMILIFRDSNNKTINAHILDKAFKHLFLLLAYTDMSYVATIEKYILTVMPEIVTSAWMVGCVGDLERYTKFLAQHKDYIPYIRLVVPPEDCHPISRSSLYRLVTASIAIAECYTPSFENYKIDRTNPVYKGIKSLAEKYISIKSQGGVAMLLNNPHAGLAEQDRANLMAIFQEFHTDNNTEDTTPIRE